MARESTQNGLRRHLDGWQAGLLALLLGGAAILLVTPRAVEPTEWPAPPLEPAALERAMTRDRELARSAVAQSLDVEVRELGRELRAYNEAAAVAEDDEFARARQRVVEAAVKVAHRGDELERLRAYQLERFLAELEAWRASGVVSDELRALSGDFVDTLGRNGWCVAGTRELVPGERELRVLFKKRWNAILGADGDALALTPEEERVRLGFLLAHPFVHRDALGRAAPADPSRFDRLVTGQRLKTIERLAALEPDYPAEFARGVAFYRAGQYQPAADAFRRHLEVRPDGPLALRARNHLKASLDRCLVAAP